MNAVVGFTDLASAAPEKTIYDRPTGFNRSVYTSNGYAVLTPNITYKVNDPGMSAVWCGARIGASRQGYRHGTRDRTLTTSLGPTTFALPRARLAAADGATTEWRSATVARYQRRTARVDEALLGVYLAGTNTRRLKGALAPLLRGGPMSKDAVSRLVGRLRDDVETWRNRDLAEEDIRYVFLDGWFPKVRIGGRRERVPVLVTLGVRGDGHRMILDLRLAGEKSAASWSDVISSLIARHLRRPVLAVVDGNPGLLAALQTQWPGVAIQRCTAHKLRNLQAKAPARLREELTEEYRRMIYAETASAVEQARARFTKKWQLRCPAVVDSVKEAGEELFTFLRFPDRSGRHCARPMRWSASTRNSVGGPRRRRAYRARMQCCCCSSGCCAAAR